MGVLYRKRMLVGRQEYVQQTGKRVALRAISFIMIALGTVFGVAALYTGLCTCVSLLIADWSNFGLQAAITTLSGIASRVLLVFGFRTERNVKSSRPLVLIAGHNAYLLPLQDTLVRSSDLPPTIPQAELLRAAQVGQEAPQGQLLRAATGNE